SVTVPPCPPIPPNVEEPPLPPLPEPVELPPLPPDAAIAPAFPPAATMFQLDEIVGIIDPLRLLTVTKPPRPPLPEVPPLPPFPPLIDPLPPFPPLPLTEPPTPACALMLDNVMVLVACRTS